MRIQHIDRNRLTSLASDSRQPWLRIACGRLLPMPDYPKSRILVAVDGERVHAILGLELDLGSVGRFVGATIRVLEVDPESNACGIGARLVRFAEDLAHINGCGHVCAKPGLGWGNGEHCGLGLTRGNQRPGPAGGTTSRARRSCA